MAKLVCDVEGCDNELTEGTGSKGGLPICPACRSVSYYWKHKGLKEIAHRKERLHFFEVRLDYLHPRIEKMLSDTTKRVAGAKRLARTAHH